MSKEFELPFLPSVLGMFGAMILVVSIYCTWSPTVAFRFVDRGWVVADDGRTSRDVLMEVGIVDGSVTYRVVEIID